MSKERHSCHEFTIIIFRRELERKETGVKWPSIEECCMGALEFARLRTTTPRTGPGCSQPGGAAFKEGKTHKSAVLIWPSGSDNTQAATHIATRRTASRLPHPLDAWRPQTSGHGHRLLAHTIERWRNASAGTMTDDQDPTTPDRTRRTSASV